MLTQCRNTGKRNLKGREMNYFHIHNNNYIWQIQREEMIVYHSLSVDAAIFQGLKLLIFNTLFIL